MFYPINHLSPVLDFAGFTFLDFNYISCVLYLSIDNLLQYLQLGLPPEGKAHTKNF
jgi:hypothetical protein